MTELCILLLPLGCDWHYQGKRHKMSEPGLLLLTGDDHICIPSGATLYRVTMAMLQSSWRDLEHLLSPTKPYIRPDTTVSIPADPGLIDVIGNLALLSEAAMARFVLAYSLTVENSRCSNLLRFLIAPNRDLYEFLYQNRLQPWAAAEYAKKMGMSLRKFNQMFREHYGTSLKHWLVLQRLEHARNLLETSTDKVIDIALESGFNNAAHFSCSFRQHYRMSPTDVRRGQPCFSLNQ